MAYCWRFIGSHSFLYYADKLPIKPEVFSLEFAAAAERADISLPTLRSIERGDGSVTMGAYANVLAVLVLQDDLALLGRDDVLGRKLQDAELAKRARAPKTKRK